MATLTAAHFVDSDITEGTSAANNDWTSGTGATAQARATTFPEDRTHLNGQTVDILDDGVVVADQVVAGGVVSGISGTYHIGLNYVSTVKPSKLDIEGMGIILTKKITKAIVSFYQTLKGKVGHSTSAMETVSFGTELFDGIKEVPLADGYDRDGDIIIQQDEPLPCTVRGIVLDVGAHNK